MFHKKLPKVLSGIFLFIILSVFFFFLSFEKKPPYLTVVGYINMADGLGRQSVELIKTFQEDHIINFYRTRKKRQRGYNDVDPKVIPILKKQYKEAGKIILVEDYECFHPYKLQKILGKTKNREEHILLA